MPLLDPLPQAVSPALVAATLDCLPHIAMRARTTSRTCIHIALALGAAPGEATSLLVRFIAADAVLADARWSAWRAVLRRSPFEMRQRFDALVVELIATMPLDAALRFDADDFFAALLGEAAASLHANDNPPH